MQRPYRAQDVLEVCDTVGLSGITIFEVLKRPRQCQPPNGSFQISGVIYRPPKLVFSLHGHPQKGPPLQTKNSKPALHRPKKDIPNPVEGAPIDRNSDIYQRVNPLHIPPLYLFYTNLKPSLQSYISPKPAFYQHQTRFKEPQFIETAIQFLSGSAKKPALHQLQSGPTWEFPRIRGPNMDSKNQRIPHIRTHEPLLKEPLQ